MPGLIEQALALDKALKSSVIQMSKLNALNTGGGFSGGLARGISTTDQGFGGGGRAPIGQRSAGGISADEARAQALAKRAANQRKFDEAFVRANEGISKAGSSSRQFNDQLAQQIIDAIDRLTGTLDRNDARTGGGL